MAEAVVSIALETLRDLLEEGRFLSGVSAEVKALEALLKEVKCLLEDADRRRRESKTVLNWIAEIRDLAHRAEDAIETYAFHVSSNKRRRFTLKRLLSCSAHAFFLHRIASEISEIRSEISRVTKSMQEYGIQSIIHGETPAPNQKWKRQTFPFETEECFVGKKDKLKQILYLIVEDNHNRVISIWGMGGIGKTTIARKVCNHIEAKRSFDCFAWVCITQQCHIRSVLEDVLRQLVPQKRDDVPSLSDTELVGQLWEIQHGRRCLIVLDDIWEIDHWDGLKHAFAVQGSRSKIMLTTRNRKLADMNCGFEVGVLNMNDGFELLKMKAFPHTGIPDFSVEEKLFRKIGEEMVRKCGYLPLVISVLGGLLRTRKSIKEWEIVNEDINAYLYRGECIRNDQEIHGVLSLSYEDLPYYLKPCFLYLSLFKEDDEICSRALYWMWIAQGMIPHEKVRSSETLMDLAEVYLGDLASRCIVEVEVEGVIQGRKYRSCKLHDVVRELCLSEGKTDFCTRFLDYQGGKFSSLLHDCLSGTKTRHLAIHLQKELELELEVGSNDFTVIGDEFKCKHIRSLLFFNHVHGKISEFPHPIVHIQKFKLVKVLVFYRFSFPGRKLSRDIGNLIHLRQLCFDRCELDELPSSISNLVYLYSLDLANSWNVRIPETVLRRLIRLKHLILPPYHKENLGKFRVRLDEGLDEMETLIGFDSAVHKLQSITRMKNLRRLLGVVRDNESLLEIIKAFTTVWKNLKAFGLSIEHGCALKFEEEEGWTNLKKMFACPNLYKLKICVHVGKLLVECRNQIIISKLVQLELYECEIEEDAMELLGKLQLLEILSFSHRSFVGEEMKCHALSFPRLKHLNIESLLNLKEWTVEQGAMPVLTKLHISNCSHLKIFPDGLRFVGTLQVLEILHMDELQKRVSDEGGEDFDKVRHIPSVLIG